MSRSYEKNGLKVTLVTIKGSDFFPKLKFKVEVGNEKRIDYVDSSKELDKYMYLSRQKDLAKAYYDLIV